MKNCGCLEDDNRVLRDEGIFWMWCIDQDVGCIHAKGDVLIVRVHRCGWKKNHIGLKSANPTSARSSKFLEGELLRGLFLVEKKDPLCRNFLQKSFPAVLLWQNKAMIFDIPGPQNRDEGTFAKTALLRNRPFVSSREVSALSYIFVGKLTKRPNLF